MCKSESKQNEILQAKKRSSRECMLIAYTKVVGENKG